MNNCIVDKESVATIGCMIIINRYKVAYKARNCLRHGGL